MAQGLPCPVGLPSNAEEVLQHYSELLGEHAPGDDPRKVVEELVANGLFKTFDYQEVLTPLVSSLTAASFLGVSWNNWLNFLYSSKKARDRNPENPSGRSRYFPEPKSGRLCSIHATFSREDILDISAHWGEVFPRLERLGPELLGLDELFEAHLLKCLGARSYTWPAGLPTEVNGFYRQYGKFVTKVLRCSRFRGSRELFEELQQDIWARLMQSNVLHQFARMFLQNNSSRDPEYVAKCCRGYLKCAVLRHFANWVRDRVRHTNSEFVLPPNEDGTAWETTVPETFPGSQSEECGVEEITDMLLLLDHHGKTLSVSCDKGSNDERVRQEGEATETFLNNVNRAVGLGYTLPQAVKAAAKSNSHREMTYRLSRIRRPRQRTA